MRLLEGFFLASLLYGAATLALYTKLLFVQAADESDGTCSSSTATESDSSNCHAHNSFSSSSLSRFPRYGTAEYAQACPWILSSVDPTPPKDCSILVRPDPAKNNEGISWWVSEIVEQVIISQLLGCKLLIDYMPGVNIEEVLVPPRDRTKSDGTAIWAVPPEGYECTPSNMCYLVDRPNYKNEERIAEIRTELAKLGEDVGKELVRVPQYRFAYFSQISPMTKWKLYREDYQQLQRAIPNFDLQTGYSCALESQFHLSKRAEQFEPDLFTNIIPTLRNEENLVITVYYRSNFADSRAKAEKEGKDFVEETERYKRAAKSVLNCALAREEEFLSKHEKGGNYPGKRTADFSRIVWMVVSDSVTLKDWIMAEYNGNNTNANIPLDRQRYEAKVIPRTIITTRARGIHTRAKRNTSTADWAEAMIDWWLIGESDVVLSSGSMSFGETAALRTQRPMYLFQNQKECTRLDLILPKGNSTGDDNHNGPRIWIPQ